MSSVDSLDAYATLVCSALSLFGSALVIVTYTVTKTTTNPRAAQLICNLAITDFLWFVFALVESSFWVSGNTVPAYLCYVASPIINFMRMASLMWTCVISFDVYMTVTKRKWYYARTKSKAIETDDKYDAPEEGAMAVRPQADRTELQQEDSQQAIADWRWYKRSYYAVVLLFSLPGALLNLIQQHGTNGDGELGCSPGYEDIGSKVAIFFTEFVPICIGFCANVYVFLMVRNKMSQKAYPQSVRKKRRRIMYHYIIVCIICWSPTMIFYICVLCGLTSRSLEVISRASLYLTGFFNCLVFGMQDPHLSRAIKYCLYSCGCHKVPCFEICCGLDYFNIGSLSAVRAKWMKTADTEKNVMFGGHLESGADQSKDRQNIYRYHKLSVEDKALLYKERPDLNPRQASVSSLHSDEEYDKEEANTSIDSDMTVQVATGMPTEKDREHSYDSDQGSCSSVSQLSMDTSKDNQSSIRGVKMGESSEKDDRGIGEEKNSNSDGSSSPTTTQFMGSATVGGTNNDNLTALDVHDIESGNEGSLKRRLLSADYSNVLRGDVMEEEDSSDDDQDYEDIGLQSWMPK
jgi:hypothetical protein